MASLLLAGANGKVGNPNHLPTRVPVSRVIRGKGQWVTELTAFVLTTVEHVYSFPVLSRRYYQRRSNSSAASIASCLALRPNVTVN